MHEGVAHWDDECVCAAGGTFFPNYGNGTVDVGFVFVQTAIRLRAELEWITQ